MSASVYRRLGAIVALAAIGVGLAIAGNAVSLDASADTADAVGQLSVSGDYLTVSDGTREVVGVANLSEAQGLEVVNEDGVFAVRIESDQPLTRAERDRAAEIARSNGTVSDYLRTVEDYSLDIQPIEKVGTDAVRNFSVRETASIEGSVDSGSASGDGSFVFVESDREDGSEDESVTITRNRTYVDGEANVRVYGPDGEVRYSLVVDLTSGRVEDITDWTETRNG